MKAAWREAASLILTARIKQTSNHRRVTQDLSNVFNYKVLMLKRSSKSKFMPNAYVFPGGVLSSADMSRDWLDFFRVHGVHATELEKLTVNARDRPLLMTEEAASSTEVAVKRDIAFRLTALRETFEESGVLLHTTSCKQDAFSQSFAFQSEHNLSSLRKRVHDNPDEFLKLYKELELMPDIFSLTEWSDWLTPTDLHEQGRRRFDTIFYTAHLNHTPTTVLDQAEIASVEWTDPYSILARFYDRELWLAPPQVYELSRMLNLTCVDRLAEFCADRAGEGCVSWLPVRLECEDGLLSLLPGDHLYPESPDYLGDPNKKQLNVFKGSLRESEVFSTSSPSPTSSTGLNRIEFKDTYDCHPRVTISPTNGHVVPMQFDQFKSCHGAPESHNDCKDCSDQQQRFCHKQSKGSWSGDFNERDLKKGRNQAKNEKFDEVLNNNDQLK